MGDIGGAASVDSLQLLADIPIESDADDRLGFAAYADALAELLDHPTTSTPLTVAVTGPWGSGKTSLAQMVAERLHRWPTERGEPAHIVCWFNAWLHDDAPNLGAAFAAEVARVTARHRPWYVRVLRPLPGRMLPTEERWRRRLGLLLLSLAPVALVVAWSALRGPGDGLTDLQRALGLDQAAGLTAVSLVALTLWTTLASSADTAGRFFRDPAGEAGRGSVNEVRRQLGDLVHQATGGSGRRRLIVFVDDLERCVATRAVEICEKAYQLFGHRDVAVVLIADAGALAEAAERKHGAAEGSTYGHRYLEKLVQIQFSLPPVGARAMRALLRAVENQTSGAPSLASASTITLPTERLSVRRLLSHPWRWTAALLVVAVVMTTIAGFTEDAAGDPGNQALYTTGGALLLADLVCALGATANSVARLLARRRSRSARLQIDQTVEALATGAETDARDLAGEVLRAAPVSAGRAPLVERRVQRYLVDTSDARHLAEAELLRSPPQLPRDAKRLLNQLRVLLAVALRRGLLGADPALTASHLGRWVVLQHRWPDVARALVRDPGLAARLEACTTRTDLRRQVGEGPVALDDPDADALLHFVHDAPSLSGALDRLVQQVPTTVA